MKNEMLETISELQSRIERELEWKLTDVITTKEAHAILNPVTYALDMVYERIKEIELESN